MFLLFENIKFKVLLHQKRVAQWIEHQIPILKVKGSIPFMLRFLFLKIWGCFGFDI